MAEIKAIISDFDGTIADTFEANYKAYERAFREVGLSLEKDTYRACFGFRYDTFMQHVGITDSNMAQQIRELKKEWYPHFFDAIRLNTKLLDYIQAFHNQGGKTAIASTARKENMLNVISHFGIADLFDVIQSGESVRHSKPDPEIYIQTMNILHVNPTDTLIFEDTPIGIEAAKASGVNYIQITDKWYN